MRCEIRDISLPDKVVEDMQRQVNSHIICLLPQFIHLSLLNLLQVSAERKKRAAILESEGSREAAVNEAEGLKRSVILSSEARRMEQINNAEGEAEAIRARARATADAIQKTAEAIMRPVCFGSFLEGWLMVLFCFDVIPTNFLQGWLRCSGFECSAAIC